MNCCCFFFILTSLKARQKNRTKRRRYIVSFIARYFITETFSFWVTSEHQTHLVGAARQSKNYGQMRAERRMSESKTKLKIDSHTWAGSTWTTKTFKKELILFAYFRMPSRNHPTMHAFGRFFINLKECESLTSQMSQLVLQKYHQQHRNQVALCFALRLNTRIHLKYTCSMGMVFLSVWWWFIHRTQIQNAKHFWIWNRTWFTHIRTYSEQ